MTDIKELFIERTATIRAALQQLDKCGTGVLLLNHPDGTFERTVTDGDIRRLLLEGAGLDDAIARLGAIESIVLRDGFTRLGALELLSKFGIDQIPVLDSSGKAVRLIHRRDLDERIYLSSPHMGQSEREFIEEAFRSNWIAPLGPNVDAFERELAEVLGMPHAAAVSSGTAAIHLGLVLLNVGRGDEVLCSAFTFAASANPILYQGAEPVFVDSEPESWNMSPSALDAALSDARRRGKVPRAAIVVNLYGQSADYDAILDLCERVGVPVLEDAAESLGARYKGRPSGTYGKLAAFSFNGNKIITTSGGGMLVSRDRQLIERARYLATQAREPAPHYEHVVVGYNYRMSNVLAGIGRGQLRVLGDRVAARRRIFERYREELRSIEAIRWMPEPDWSFGTRWLSTFTIDPARTHVTRNDVIAALAAEQIEARPLWKPMQLQPVFAGCRYFGHEGGSVSEELFSTGVCLPSGSNMTPSQQDRVIETLLRLFRC